MQCTIGCCGHRRKKTMKIYGLVRLTKDAEVRYSQAAQPMAIASFSVAAPRKFRKEGEPEADFFECVAFGGKAEFISKYFKKGSRAFIEGDLRNDNYVNKEG
ncbi:MAG: single-stranded DNA-binding protein, partial [Lachnospiraceae bacterium]|nr:single-stranded DNA-binding protein [Lachnospiraceae bacterium]